MIRATVTAAAAAATLAALAGPASTQAAEEPLTARAELMDREGRTIGQVRLTETPFNGVLLRIEASGLKPGSRAIHIHETGRCDPPDFMTAGGHYNPRGAGHGVLHPHGVHAGDLLNLEVPSSGRVVTERLAPHVTLRAGLPNSLLEGDGTAIIIHADRDDYVSQPTGDAGGRVACGAIRRSP